MAVPNITIAPSGCVMLAPGVPENCTVLVVGLAGVCAPARAPNAKITTRQAASCLAAEDVAEFKLCLPFP